MLENVGCLIVLVREDIHPGKMNMDPKYHPIERENTLPTLNFWVPCYFRGCEGMFYPKMTTVFSWQQCVGGLSNSTIT